MEHEIFFAGEGYILRHISDADRADYGELLRQTDGTESLPSEEKWNKIVKGVADRYFSIFDEHGEYCGCIELQNCISKTPEIGLTLLESKRNQGIAAKVVKLLVQKACSEQEIEYFVVKIKAENSHSRHVFEKMGAVKIGEEEYALTKLHGLLNDHELKLVRKALDLAKASGAEEELTKAVYLYKLSPGLFSEVTE